ncbi:MAG: hypothetical protein WCE79_02290 [Xanthobacteraceae bacterium]
MAVNKPVRDNARKGAVRKRSQLETKMQGEEHWTKRSQKTGRFMNVKKSAKKFKGVRREKAGMTSSPKQGGDGLRDRDKSQGDLRDSPASDRELPEGLKRERKGPLDNETGRKPSKPT